MPWPKEQKQRSRERIVNSAYGLFAARGYDNVTIGDVMREAQLTHGAFYSHFDSKQALYAEAIVSGARGSALAKLGMDAFGDDVPLNQLLASYLDPAHARREEYPCPLAFLATDVANREEEVRAAYTDVFKRLVALIRKELPGDSPSPRSRALALSALMVGGVAVARALDDERSAESLLSACTEMAEEFIS